MKTVAIRKTANFHNGETGDYNRGHVLSIKNSTKYRNSRKFFTIRQSSGIGQEMQQAENGNRGGASGASKGWQGVCGKTGYGVTKLRLIRVKDERRKRFGD